jgi:hypothetical protein
MQEKAMNIQPLSPELTEKVLSHLGITAVPKNLTFQFLDQLIHAYCRTVPWESASRIARRAAVLTIADCPRWPEEFWQTTLTKGTGGTCFESNYAYLAFLGALGYEGYLTLNNMGERIGCHSAIVIILNGQKWLVDAGYPVYASLPLSQRGVMVRTSQFLRYTIRPYGRHQYQIEQWPHPVLVGYTLVDQPVAVADYRARTVADYEENGLFLDAVIINKVIADELWRFNMRDRPWVLNRFKWGQRFDRELDGDAATAVAQHFNIDKEVVGQAFQIVNSKL